MHHAYYIEGTLSDYEPLEFTISPVHREKHERFGIDEARQIIEAASLKNYADNVYVIEASSITSEAQQALLKLFEEPQSGTHFILVVPHGALLPTLRSRMFQYPAQRISSKKSSEQAGQTFSHKSAASFLSASSKDRSAKIAKLLKEEEFQRDKVRDFLNALELELAKKIKEPAVQAGLQDIASVRSYVSDRSPSLKMLLEHLAIALPKL